MKYKKKVLKNGLRIITVPVKDNPLVTVMVLTETGANNESKSENGISHFLEHMCFKGTQKRLNSLAVNGELERIGAENNAYTSRELTGYYAKAGKKHLDKLMDVISDIYLDPTLPEADLEKERGVILQEISMYEDLPKRKVWDTMWATLYGDTSFGRTVLGPSENIKKISRKDLVKYHKTNYIAEKTVVIVSGDVSEKEVAKKVSKYFKDIKTDKKPSQPKIKERQKKPNIGIYKKNTDQTHMIITFRAFGAKDKKGPALDVLAAILGKGMSSRLFQKMREEMGACYYINAGTQYYSSYGFFYITTGIESKRSQEVVRALLAECNKMKEELVPEDELNKAKEYYIGRMYMDLETTDGLADFYADSEVSTKAPKTPQEIEKEIRAVKAKDIQKAAKDIFKNEKLNMALVGKANEASLKRVLKL